MNHIFLTINWDSSIVSQTSQFIGSPDEFVFHEVRKLGHLFIGSGLPLKKRGLQKALKGSSRVIVA